MRGGPLSKSPSLIEKIVLTFWTAAFIWKVKTRLSKASWSDLWEITQVVGFAAKAHGGQRRNWSPSNELYIYHPLAVALLVSGAIGATVAMIKAAVLHDVVEDTEVSLETIVDVFGADVGDMVEDLTDVSRLEDGNRAVRKKKDFQHTAAARPQSKTIKLADIAHNAESIIKGNPKFARKTWVPEKLASLEVLGEGDSGLFRLAKAELLKCKGAAF